VVQLLVEQVEYLRAQLGMATTTVSRAAAGQPPAITEFPDIPYEQHNTVSDEEEHLHSMLQAKVISQVEFDQGIERLKARTNADIIE
jgi:hypothetical protein